MEMKSAEGIKGMDEFCHPKGLSASEETWVECKPGLFVKELCAYGMDEFCHPMGLSASEETLDECKPGLFVKEHRAYGTGLREKAGFMKNDHVILVVIDYSENGGEGESVEIKEHHKLTEKYHKLIETLACGLTTLAQEIRKYQPDAFVRVVHVIKAGAHKLNEGCIESLPAIVQVQQEGVEVKLLLSTIIGGMAVVPFTNLFGNSKGDYPEFIKVGLYVGYVNVIGLTFYGLMSKKMAMAAVRAAAGMLIAKVTLEAVYVASENVYIKCAIGVIGTMGALAMALIK